MCKPRRRVTASGRSPERRRSSAEAAAADGNVWQNWGYLARLWQAQKERCRQQQGRLGSERDGLARRGAWATEFCGGGVSL